MVSERQRDIVEGYIADNIGPKALIRDLAKTARVVSRFGPALPQMVENALMRQKAINNTPEPPPSRSWPKVAAVAIASLGLGVALGIWL